MGIQTGRPQQDSLVSACSRDAVADSGRRATSALS